jgi:hypothetical protein
MANANALNTNFTVTGANKALTQPTQPCFAAKVSNTTITNVTGDGTKYFVIFNSVTFDNLSNYNSGTGIFTVPVTGRYFFATGLLLTGVGVAHTAGTFALEYAGTFTLTGLNNTAVAALGTNFTYTGSTIIPLTAGDSVRVSISVSNSTKTVSVLGGVGNTCWFHGVLLD